MAPRTFPADWSLRTGFCNMRSLETMVAELARVEGFQALFNVHLGKDIAFLRWVEVAADCAFVRIWWFWRRISDTFSQ